jgi:hypothetical protein
MIPRPSPTTLCSSDACAGLATGGDAHASRAVP